MIAFGFDMYCWAKFLILDRVSGSISEVTVWKKLKIRYSYWNLVLKIVEKLCREGGGSVKDLVEYIVSGSKYRTCPYMY